MEFRPIMVRGSAGEDVLPIPELLVLYCKALEDVPPSTEVYLGDPEYDVRTLHSSAGFRDALVRYGTRDYDALVVDWSRPEQHEINDTGTKWTPVMGTALKYVVAYTEGETTTTVYMGIGFGDLR
ncbi:MAG: hypothetical protein JNL28_06295 [Planctomycetes bacterium]|nr:hypothetical protein [Planctomycetota bacterium]